MKLCPCSVSSGQDDSSLSSEEEAEMSEPTWLAADLGAASDLSPPSRGERMRHSPQNTHSKEDDGKTPLSHQWSALVFTLWHVQWKHCPSTWTRCLTSWASGSDLEGESAGLHTLAQFVAFQAMTERKADIKIVKCKRKYGVTPTNFIQVFPTSCAICWQASIGKVWTNPLTDRTCFHKSCGIF